MIRLGILGSTRGTNLAPIVSAIQAQQLSATIAILLSNKISAPILTRAKKFKLFSEYVPVNDLSRAAYDAKVTTILHQHHVDLIVLIGYMRILSPEFVQTWEQKIINVHPSLLPAHAGKMDLAVHAAVLAANESETGCTVHYVTQEVDAGPIILQKKCSVCAHDTPETLKQRVQTLEGAALVAAIKSISNL